MNRLPAELEAKILAMDGVKVLSGPPLPKRDDRPIVETVTEKAFQSAVIKEAKKLGYLVYHTYDSRKSQRGFPDLVLIRDRVVWMELKTESGKPSADQLTWMERLKEAGAEVYLFRPSDWERILEVLK